MMEIVLVQVHGPSGEIVVHVVTAEHKLDNENAFMVFPVSLVALPPSMKLESVTSDRVHFTLLGNLQSAPLPVEVGLRHSQDHVPTWQKV